jgi:WD40 repeat protein/transcriptional regulator with XRE-family HTH domain
VSAGSELRRFREERQLSLAELADRVHYSKGQLSKLETGRKPIRPEVAAVFDRVLDTGGYLHALVSPGAVCPYPGLAAFDQDRAKWFFGRDKAVEEIINELRRRQSGMGPLFVVGASGSGKSSLLRAGLLTALSEGDLPGFPDCRSLVFTPTADPLSALATQVSRVTKVTPEDIKRELTHDPTRIVTCLRQVSASSTGHRPTVLIVDQFEETFTLCKDERQRQAFIRALCAAAESSAPATAFVVLGLRADFYPSCLNYPELIAALRHGHFPLGAMNHAELREAIEEPARAVGLDVESGLTEILLRDLGQIDETVAGSDYQPGTLPLLSHALLAIWEKRAARVLAVYDHRKTVDDRKLLLTLDDYRNTGEIAQCIAATANKAYSELDSDAQTLARTLLVRLVEIGDSADKDTRRYVKRDQLTAGLADSHTTEIVLNTLIHERLITGGSDTFAIIHECLLRAWPRLRDWIEIDRDGLLVEQRLREAVTAWERDGRHEAGLYRGPRLQAAQERVATSTASLPVVTREFLRASAAHEDSERAAAVRRTRRLRQLAAVLCVLVALAAVATTDALGQRDAARSREIAGAATGIRLSKPVLSAQLALVALNIKDTPEARGAVMTAELSLNPTRRINEESKDAVSSVAFNDDGMFLAAASLDGTVRVWASQADSDLARPFTHLEHDTRVLSVVFDPRGRRLVTSGDNVIRGWSIAGPSTKRGPVFEKPAAHSGPLAINENGTLMATGGSRETTIRLWDMTGPEPRALEPELTRHQDDVLAVAFTPDRKILASASADGVIVLWDVTSPKAPRPYDKALTQGDRNPIQAISISHDGRLLASARGDATVALWNIENSTAPRLLSILRGFPGPVNDVKFSPTDDVLAAASKNTIQLWNVTDAANATPRVRPMIEDAGEILSVAFKPHGHTLATASQGRAVEVWETDIKSATRDICARATPTISEEQWKQYLPGRSYDPPCPQQIRAAAPAPGNTPPVAPSTTQLIAEHSNKCVAIKEDIVAEGAPPIQLTCAPTPGMNWSLQPQGSLYRIRNELSRMCLESSDYERKDGEAALVVQRPCAERTEQLWHIQIKTPGVPWTEVAFSPADSDISDCMNINHESQEDGEHVIRWPCRSLLASNTLFRILTTAIPRR